MSVGAALMAAVPLSEVYIEANYREVQLGHIRAGQRAGIHVDAYNIDLEGQVVDVPAAPGTTFATLQPDNATGNFTKIVQRLPVKIVLAPDQPTARLLRVGLSVEATIETESKPLSASTRKLASEAKPEWALWAQPKPAPAAKTKNSTGVSERQAAVLKGFTP